MDFGAAILAFFATTLIKVPVMLFTGWLLWRVGQGASDKTPKKLWLLVRKEDRAAHRLLFYSLIFFAASEIFCGIETYILMKSHSIGRIAHSLTSALGVALFFIGAYELLQARALHFLEKRCFLRAVCSGCPVLENRTCNFRGLLSLVVVAVGVMAIPPLFASVEPMVAQPLRYLLPFETLNIWYDNSVIPFMKMLNPGYLPIGDAFYLYSAPQILNYRIYPIMVIIMMVVALFLVGGKSSRQLHLGVLVLLFGSGFLSFTYYELVLYRMTGDLFIGAVGHEIGELIFLLFITIFLRRMLPVNERTS
jgi:hypothetical protein